MKIEQIEKILTSREPGIAETCRAFALFLPLVEKDGELNLLYELRSFDMDRQPGEVCFPGGEKEESETNIECAVRETCEELGVKPDDVHVISEIDTVHNYNNSTIYCFIGTIGYESLKDAKFNRDEVEELFLVPVEFFMNTEPEVIDIKIVPDVPNDFPYDKIGFSTGYKWKTGVMKVPVYTYENKAIWGLTGRITANLAGLLKGGRGR